MCVCVCVCVCICDCVCACVNKIVENSEQKTVDNKLLKATLEDVQTMTKVAGNTSWKKENKVKIK